MIKGLTPRWRSSRKVEPPPQTLILVLCPALRRGTLAGWDDGVRRARYEGGRYLVLDSDIESPEVTSWYQYPTPFPRAEPRWVRERTVSMVMALEKLAKEIGQRPFSHRESGVSRGTLEALCRRGDLTPVTGGRYQMNVVEEEPVP